MRLPIIVLLLFFFSPVFCSDWSIIGSDQEQLKDHVIVAVGAFSSEEKYDNDTFERTEWFEFKSLKNNFCFEFVGYPGYFGYGDQACILLMDKDENLKIAIFEIDVYTIKVTVESIRIIKCPSNY